MSLVKEIFIKNSYLKSKQLKELELKLNDDCQNISLDIESSSKKIEIKNDSYSSQGHRKRLKEKFLNSGFLGFHDYEIIELILFQAIPRKDTKPLAKLLLNTFGTVQNIFQASEKQIIAIKDCGYNVYYTLQLFSQMSLVIAKEQINQAPLLTKWTELSRYLRLKMGYLTHEEFHILFLNSKSYLISDMKIFRGTIDKATIYPREILKHALECGAVAIILAHNHPSGEATPSHDDIKVTYQIIQAAQIMNIKVIDHVIVGKHDIKSFRNLNLI